MYIICSSCYKTAVFTLIFVVFVPQFMAEINKAAMLEFYFRFRFWPHYSQQRVASAPATYHNNGKANLHSNRTSHYSILTFSSLRQVRRKSISGFQFGDVLHLKRSKTISISNFDKLSQSAGEILLLPVFKNRRPPY